MRGEIVAAGLFIFLWPAAGQTPAVTSGDLAAKSDLALVQSEIKDAQAEDARYTGGLVKALIASRIAILHQTEAMLEQKVLALKHGVRVQYSIDGKAFSPPLSPTLADVESEIATSESKIKAQEAEAARYSGGLTQAMSSATLETLKQTRAMLEQKRASLKYGLPQYVGSFDATSDASNPTVASGNSPVAEKRVANGPRQSSPDELQGAIVLTVVEKGFIPANPSAKRFQAVLTLKCSYENTSKKDIRAFTGKIVFQDLFEKEIYTVGVTISQPISAGNEAIWNGSINYNQFVTSQQRFLGMQLQDMKMIWVPTAIIFADGTRIGEGS